MTIRSRHRKAAIAQAKVLAAISAKPKRARKESNREVCKQAYLNHMTAVWSKEHGYPYNSKHILTDDELELAIAGK